MYCNKCTQTESGNEVLLLLQQSLCTEIHCFVILTKKIKIHAKAAIVSHSINHTCVSTMYMYMCICINFYAHVAGVIVQLKFSLTLTNGC